MSYDVHKQLSSPRSSGRPSGATRDARKRWATATAAALLILGLAPVAQAAEGKLDPTFGVSSDTGLGCVAAGGVMTCDVAGDIDQLRGMALLPDGRIVVGGRADGAPDGNGDFVIARFRNNGSLDTTFGVGGPDGRNGLETTDVRGSIQPDEVNDLVLDHDGKIVLVGSSGGGGSREFAVARYTADGKLDTAFATGGIAMPPFPGGGDTRATAVAVQPTDQKIVVAISLGSQGTPSDFVLARFMSEGQLDTSFGGNGFVETSFPDSERETALAVLVQPDGKIVAGGRAGPINDDSPLVDFALVRYNQDGSLDDAFGTDGRVRTDFNQLAVASQRRAERVQTLVLQPDGKIVAGGNSTIGDSPIVALARYEVNGALDPSFGTGGTETTPFPGQPGSMNKLILQPGGKLVAVGRTGRTNDSATGDFALVRYQPNGREDTTFGEDKVDDLLEGPPEGVPDGFTLTRFGPLTSASTWRTVVLQPEGNIVVAGFHRPDSRDNSGADFALARYRSSVVPPNLTCQGRPPTVIGTPGDDILVGTPGGDVIHGLEGIDTIIAQGGDDIICGGPGGDMLFGGLGDDAIEGGDGADRLIGDSDSGPGGSDTLLGGEGDDSLFGAAGSDRLEGEGGIDELFGGPGEDVLNGGADIDELVGGPGNDVLNGGLGDDRVFGEEGGDTLAGDAGDDTLVGDEQSSATGGPDVLHGGDGDDRLFGAGGNDRLEGDAGDDELVGGPGDDVLLNGGPGIDELVGGLGDDVLNGGADGDELAGGPGDDVLNGGPGADLLAGEDGTDTLDGATGDDTLIGDDLVGAGSPDVLRGGEGDDKLFGAAGDDRLFGDAGRDELDGGPGNDTLDGGTGDDLKLFGASGVDTIHGGPGRFRDRLVGGPDRDVLRGGPGNDHLFGGPGRDRMFGGGGKDKMDGQGGQDSGNGGGGSDQCFSMGRRGSCETKDEGSPPNPPPPSPPPSPPRPIPTTPGSSPSPIPPPCNFPQCGA